MWAENIAIEYYFADTFDEESEETEDEDIEDEIEDPEYGSQLSVLMKHQNKYYQFLMYHDVVEIGVPVMLIQTILFLVRLIEQTEPDRLIEYLTSLATDPLIPHELPDKEFRDVANKMLKLKFQTIHNLNQEGKADLS